MRTTGFIIPVNTSFILAALGAAILFGASVPFAKWLVGEISALLLAGLLYLGSGVGLFAARLIRERGWRAPGLTAIEWPWLLGAIGFGGILGPVLLMFGLIRASASTAALLLNLEVVFTALLAWIVFRENAGVRVIFGMVLIISGGVALAWPSDSAVADWFGSLLVAGACLCWAIDNNFTRKVSASDALFIAGSKGLAAGTVNTALALVIGTTLPAWSYIGAAMLVGFFGYGVSLVLFVLALRGLGAARTGAYFATAPFIGALIAVILFAEPTTALFWTAAALMAAGVWLHVTERHTHKHVHEAMSHSHTHVHDEHHQHAHDFPWDGSEPHSHEHRHAPLTHSHPHYPDIHHRHRH